MTTSQDEHVVLVAFSIHGDGRGAAMLNLMGMLPRVIDDRDDDSLVSWWIAEDDRIDGSDNDSAVFVHPGCQHMASRVLVNLGMSGDCNLIDWRRSADSRFEGEQV